MSPEEKEKIAETISERCSEMFIAINSGEYTFPEFGTLKSKVTRKKYSLLTLAAAQRMFKLWMDFAVVEESTHAGTSED